jgi:hypothetical protein
MRATPNTPGIIIARGASQVRKREIAALQSPGESRARRAVCLIGQGMVARSLGAVLLSHRFDHRVTVGLVRRKPPLFP